MRRMSPQRSGLIKRIALVSAGAVLLLILALYLWSTGEGEGAGIPCPVRLLTGFYCPGCGASRALRSVLHLELYQALRYNVMVTLALPFAAAYFAALAYSYIRYGEDRVSRRVPSGPLWWALAAVLLFGVLRNLPWFSFLAPTVV